MDYNEHKLSDYTKEELPTWAEVYNEFYKNKLYIYEAYNQFPSDIDLYWKIPHKKFLMMTVCNQFNKMIYEDESFKSDFIKFINENISDEVTNVMFMLNDKPLTKPEYPNQLPQVYTTIDHATGYVSFVPMIYSINMPSGKPNPFIISNHRYRAYNDSLCDDVWMTVVMIVENSNKNRYRYYLNRNGQVSTEADYESYNSVIEYMMKPFKDYFEGESIGWKDGKGNVIDSEPLQRECGAGYDPAL